MGKKRRGKFIVIEGGVGSGKSTVFRKLKRNFKDWKYYREPGSTPFGERVRKAVQGRYGFPVDSHAAVFGYSAARANLIRHNVSPELKKGITVVLDRYWFSTYAYQGTEGVSKSEIVKISKLATDGILPDLVLHLDQDPKIGIARKKGKKDTDRYDLKDIRFHNKIRRNYLELSKKYKSIWKLIDATDDKNKVYNNVIGELKKAKII